MARSARLSTPDPDAISFFIADVRLLERIRQSDLLFLHACFLLFEHILFG
jgi:hypothetical protein